MRASSFLLKRTSGPPVFDSARPVVSNLSAIYSGHELDFLGKKGGQTQLTISSGKGENAGPMQLLLYALASCALTDVVTILKKQKSDFSPTTLKCDILAQRSAEGARPYEKIHLSFSVCSEKTNEDAFARAVDLSIEKYCGVHASISSQTQITHSSSVVKKQ